MNVNTKQSFVIFLDPSDVLICSSYAEKHIENSQVLNSISFKNFQEIVHELQQVFNVSIVFSNPYPFGFDLEKAKEKFKGHQFSKCITDATNTWELFSEDEIQNYCKDEFHKDSKLQCKAVEIKDWLLKHREVENYLIFNNPVQGDHLSVFKDHLVEVKPNQLITKGIKNDVLVNRCGKRMPQTKARIIREQKAISQVNLDLPQGIPPVKQFYFYAEGCKLSDVNMAAANDLAEMWGSYIKFPPVDNQMFVMENGRSEPNLYKCDAYISIDTFKNIIKKMVLAYLQTNNITHLHLNEGVFNSAIQEAHIDIEFKDFPYEIHVELDKDGIHVTKGKEMSSTCTLL